jgi:hypothetical protein
MAKDVRAPYDKAAATSRAIKSVIPVGEAAARDMPSSNAEHQLTKMRKLSSARRSKAPAAPARCSQ